MTLPIRRATRSIIISNGRTSLQTSSSPRLVICNRHFHSSSSTSSTNNNALGRQVFVPRRRRSVHFVPADNIKFLTKSLTLGADTVIYDLEDSVRDKNYGREVLRSYLDSIIADSAATSTTTTSIMPKEEGMTELLVRINPLSNGELWKEDIIATYPGCDGFMIPKVESMDELRLLDEYLTELEQKEESSSSSRRRRSAASRPKVLFPIATETPLAVINIVTIARGPRVCAITWGCEDLSATMGSPTTRHDITGEYLDIYKHCRNMCLLAAKAANVQAIDGIYQNVRDINGFSKEASDAMRMGFDGKLTLHPHQIEAVHVAFEPTNSELDTAARIISLWEDGSDRSSLELDGRMIDMPHYVRAKKVVARSSGNTTRHAVVNNFIPKKEIQHSSVTTTIKNESDTPVQQQQIQQQQQQQQQIQPQQQQQEEIFPRVYMGKYFEDLTPGLKIRHYLTRTVTESDNVFFTCLTLNPAPIHLDHELSKENTLGGGETMTKPLFNSMFTLALLVGMSVPEATHGTTIANLGFSEVLFPKPVYPGDTIRAESVVLDRRESKSRPTQGIVTFEHVAYNQRGEVVCKATRQALMKKKTTA
jgi:citrate lyase beta subunit/acyl dehydratase